MNAEADALVSVRNDRIQLGTMRPQGARSATLERRVIITGPRDLVQVVTGGSKQHLESLIVLLKDPDRAWAAEAMLAAMTRREEKIVDAYQANPQAWLDAAGKTAYDRWAEWWRATKDRLVWDAGDHVFVEKPS